MQHGHRFLNTATQECCHRTACERLVKLLLRTNAAVRYPCSLDPVSSFKALCLCISYSFIIQYPLENQVQHDHMDSKRACSNCWILTKAFWYQYVEKMWKAKWRIIQGGGGGGGVKCATGSYLDCTATLLLQHDLSTTLHMHGTAWRERWRN